MINIADLKDPEDSAGRSYREVNNDKEHSLPIGTLVDFCDGVRLWVVSHGRDCDGTPLYYLSHDKDDTTKERKSFSNHSWVGGYSEESLEATHKGGSEWLGYLYS